MTSDWIKHDGSIICPVDLNCKIEVETYASFPHKIFTAYFLNWAAIKYYRVIKMNENKVTEQPEIKITQYQQSALTIQTGGNHYKNMKIQPIEYITANNIGFIEGNVIKYISRWRAKNGIEDLNKAKHFIDLLIELENLK